ncbi:DUF397 domain-containing protein, partial [Streptomyces sp. YGL11-2]|uniref:DUF397 domain-containing protein n=1 Tax=Streptomyces sp. YGL11-2 TaxID=3414028 RepID=UPI003CF86E6C
EGPERRSVSERYGWREMRRRQSSRRITRTGRHMTATLAAPLDDSNWFKSSFSGNANACVEVRFAEGGIQLRDNKESDSLVLTFSAAEWDAFLLGAFNGEFTIH